MMLEQEVFAADGNPLSLVNIATRSELMERIKARLEAGQGFSVATLNLDHVVKLRDDRAFQAAYRQQTFVVADGQPITWLRSLMGEPVDLIPGSDLVYPLSELASKLDMPIALLGATEDTLLRAAKRLITNYPNLRIVAQIAPPMGFEPESSTADAILQEITKSGAKLCFLALGAPKQERLAAQALKLAPTCGFVSIGAGLDFIAGTQTRAPHWVQKISLEWFWRMVHDPRRLALRYGRCIAILPQLVVKATRASESTISRQPTHTVYGKGRKSKPVKDGDQTTSKCSVCDNTKELSKLRILALNNVDMKTIYALWEKDNREAPSHQLWGIPQIEERGHEVEILSHKSPKFFSWVSQKIRILGNVYWQWEILQRAHKFDVVYCAHQPTISMLILLRKLRLFRTPIVALTYQLPKYNGLLGNIYANLFICGCDRLLCLSQATEEGYRRLGVPDEKLGQIRWGLDPHFYHPNTEKTTEGPAQFIAAGKTHRDYETLVLGFPTEVAHLTIFSAGHSIGINIPSDKENIIEVQKTLIGWREFGTKVASSDAVLIPLSIGESRVHNAIGLTAVLEALANGVPVVVTRNPHLGIDIEAEGVGFWVAPTDPQDWLRVLQGLASNRAKLHEMGTHGRDLIVTRYNIHRFADALVEELLAFKSSG